MECATEAELLRDSKYRAYYTQVEKALKAFESTAEWADLISALGRLNKILSSHIKYPTIPKKITIGKRLAQCLHPALPSGVHLKALETYNIIFKIIGTANLATDLFTYSSGLFPLLSYAAINVRPVVLDLYRDHFVALQKHIKPALTGLIIALLPGLEEGSEHFEKTKKLLDDFCEKVEPAYFYTCMWECLLMSINNRHAGLNFILQHFNRKLSTEDQLFILGLKIDLLVDSLIFCVSDTSALVQRSCLDLLMLCFPIHNSQLPKSDILKILTQAILVVLRRDMSLNRRLFAWILGTDINGLSSSFSSSLNDSSQNHIENHSSGIEKTDMTYFITYSKQIMIIAIKDILNNFPIKIQYDESHQIETVSSEDLLISKSFRVLISILDRQEIADLILEDIFVVILRKAYQSCNFKQIEEKSFIRRNSILPIKSTLKLQNTEALKTINLFFNFLEQKFIWLYVAKLFEKCCKSQASNDQDWMTILEYCSIVEFLIEKISLDLSTETQINHFPVLIQKMAFCIIENIGTLNNIELFSCFNLISKILQHIEPATEELLNMSAKNKINFDSNKLIVNSDDGFSDFIQFTEVSLQNECIDSSDKSKIYSFHISMLNKCIEACLAVYEAMIGHLFASDAQLIDFVLNLLFDKFNDASENWFIDQIEKQKNMKDCEMMRRLRKVTWNKDALDAMTAVCRLLVHLSLPIIFSYQNVDHTTDFLGKFPIWLKLLLVCCCLIRNNALRLEVFTCFLDLVGLTKTAIVSAKDSNQLNRHVFLNPLLPTSCLHIIEDQTNFYRLMTNIIWNNLDTHLEDCNKFSFLLHQLHNFVKEQRLCESVIISSLLSSDEIISLSSHKKFIKFWHFLNEKRKMMPFSNLTKSFDKSLFVILDGLRSENPSRSALIQSFVIQTIQRNDLIRLLEPLLLILHHPDTARISIQQLRLKENHTKKKKVPTATLR